MLLKVTVFGPGFGEAIVLEIGEELVCMVDCCRPGADYLRGLVARKEVRLGFFVLSHPHYDHYQDVERVLSLPFEKVCKFGGLHYSELREILVARSKRRPLNRKYRGAARSFSRFLALWVDLGDKRRLVTQDSLVWEESLEVEDGPVDFRVRALAPIVAGVDRFNSGLANCSFSEETGSVCAQSCNAASVVLLVSFGETKGLLTGDICADIWPRNEWGKVDFLKLPHHGSRADCSKGLVANLLKPGADSAILVAPYSPSDLPDAGLVHDLDGLVEQSGGEILLAGERIAEAEARGDWGHLGPLDYVEERPLLPGGRCAVIYDANGKRVRGEH